MASSNMELKWEWPAGRNVETKVLARIESIRPVPGGLFGIKASPSMAGALPDATEVTAVVDEQSATLGGRRLVIKLPGIEARKLKVGNWAALGLLEADSVCACVVAAPTASLEEARRWLSTVTCGS